MSERNAVAVDANIILRYLVQDDASADRVEKLLSQAENGTTALLLPELALADIVWTLEKFYKIPRVEIKDSLDKLLALRGLAVGGSKKVALAALRLYVEKNIDWSDAFMAAQLCEGGITAIYSFDRHFDRLPGLQRLEP